MSDFERLIADLVSNLTSSDAQNREHLAARLGDCFEHLLISQQNIDPDVYRISTQKLLETALREDIFFVKETLFSVLFDAALLRVAGLIDWSPVARALPNLDPRLLEYALPIVAFTHDRQYENIIREYCKNADADVRQVAEQSLIELFGTPP
jgi:hypothetical protein